MQHAAGLLGAIGSKIAAPLITLLGNPKLSIMESMKDQIEPEVNPDGTIPPVDWDRILMTILGDERELRRMGRRDKAPYLRLVVTTPPVSDKS